VPADPNPSYCNSAVPGPERLHAFLVTLWSRFDDEAIGAQCSSASFADTIFDVRCAVLSSLKGSPLLACKARKKED
jgi:hypothetical protein